MLHSRFKLAFLLFAILAPARTGAAATLSVYGADGVQVKAYRWQVEEDASYRVKPGVPDPNTLAVRFHASYMPVAASGRSLASGNGVVSVALDPAKNYFVTVMPDDTYALGGTAILAGQATARVTVNKMPLPTAQMSVFVFEDNAPINNQPDQPQETGLAGFKVVVYDAGGRYGMAGGQMMMDGFGNPIGTTYDTMGEVMQMGQGFVLTDANGEAQIKNLFPGKYTVYVTPPEGGGWVQTATIEGTKGIDAWVKAGEPAFFQEFGPPGYHVFVGFVRPENDRSVLSGGSTIRGQVVNLHTSRPPDYSFFPGEPVEGAWVGLNEGGSGGRGVFAQPCNPETGMFAIPNVPPGRYQLVIWDENLDVIFASKDVITTAGQDLNLGKVPVFNWFARMQNHVFYDRNENGFPDEDEPGLSDIALNLRWRDGSMYQTGMTKVDGSYTFSEVFPFFNWLIAEVDYTRFKPTGATVVVDNGGPVAPHNGWTRPTWGVLNPQPQFNGDGSPAVNPFTGNNLSRTERGPGVLLEAFQAFLGQTNVIHWGKTTYTNVDVDNAPKGNFPGPEDVDRNGNGAFDGSNGGIAGIVYYAVTRAEDDPRYAAADAWEPGIPRVQVNLYPDSNANGIIDDLNRDGKVTLADVDNYPFTWTNAPYKKGAEDVDRNGNGVFDYGDAMNVTTTDSWDDNQPTGAQGPPFVHLGVPTDAYDGLRNFNQVRPGVFDGGYIFTTPSPLSSEALREGTYIVEAVPPPGYKILKEEDKNVVFGESFTPAPQALAPPCVGDLHLVPAELALFPGTPCRFAGQRRPLADRKQVTLSRQQNAACDFMMFTEVPAAGHFVGIILDDLANEFDKNSPTFGEKYSPPWLPISIRDFTGREISRVYSDQYGAYSGLVPSTYSANVPCPSGFSPGMYTIVLNSPGPIIDTRQGSPTYGKPITDPYFNRQYSQFSYTFQFMPGTTTYLDTPVMRIAAFAGPDQFPLDMEYPNATPVIYSAAGPGGGPYVSATGQTLTIVSAGKVDVPNPLYDPKGTQPRLVPRDYGFGTTPGKVTLGGVALANVTWTDGSIRGTVPAGAKTGQLTVVRSNGRQTPVGVTVTVGPLVGGKVTQVQPSSNPLAHPIQDAIDAAGKNDLILVAPGRYEESVIMWKPVRLQGWGGPSTIINAIKAPSDKLQAWRNKVRDLAINGSVDLLPGQDADFLGLEPAALATEEGAGILVLGRNVPPAQGGFGAGLRARIDGLTVTGADNGGGIVLNGYASYTEVSNCIVTGNQGVAGGAIRSGHPNLTQETSNGLDYVSCENPGLYIHHNHVKGNGSLGDAGGGISIYTGTDGYLVAYNTIMGNFATGHGGGIGHQGLSHGGRIVGNKILFNQSFDQGTNPNGGGIYIGGAPALAAGGLSPGSGSVRILGNLIQGNQAGAGNGGGIALDSVNGQDVAEAPNYLDDPKNHDDVFSNPAPPAGAWFWIDIANNMITNNQAGLAGGGISMQDAVLVNIIQNTIARNESTATAGAAFAPGSPNQSAPQAAGIVSFAHSTALKARFGASPSIQGLVNFSNPVLANSIVWQNRSFYFAMRPGQDPPFGLLPPASNPAFNDLAVVGYAGGRLDPRACLLTQTAGYHASNATGDPAFVRPVFNGDRGQTLIIPEATTQMGVAPAFDEGGNYIDVRYGPLAWYNPATNAPYSDYHLKSTSRAIGAGSPSFNNTIAELNLDYDSQPRPNGGFDAGADEYYAVAGQNPAPYAQNDQFTLRPGQVLTIAAPGVLANDLDANGNTLAAVMSRTSANGVTVLNGTGGFTYSPRSGFTGNDNFIYTASDGSTPSNGGTVLLRVTSQGNTAPVARNDSYRTAPGRGLNVRAGAGVRANDSDADQDTFFTVLYSNPAHGTLKLNPDGSFTYTPAAGYSGADSFRYRAYDGSYSAAATVSITVANPAAPANNPPDPRAAAIQTTKNTAAYTRVMPNDPDPHNTFTYALALKPRLGTAVLAPTGVITYTPNLDYTGPDSMTVTVTDQGGARGTVTIPITVISSMTMSGGVVTQFYPDTDGVDTDGDGIVNNDHVMVTIGAGDGFSKMADGRLMYIFGFSDLGNIANDKMMMEGMLKAESPAPTLVFKQGQRVYLNLVNVGMVMRPDLFDPHSVHFHGFPQAAPIFDGMPDAAPAIKMGGAFTYYYQPNDPGTYIYHCHVEAVEHMQMGMIGNLWVTPIQNGKLFEYPAGSGRRYSKFVYNDGDGSTGYDVEFPIQMDAFDANFHEEHLGIQPLPFQALHDDYPMLNGRGYPDTVKPGALPPLEEAMNRPTQKLSSLVTAAKGQRILLRVSNVSVSHVHTLGVAGLEMQVVGMDAKLLRDASGKPMYFQTRSLTLGGGETADVIIDTANAAPGTYFLYSTNLDNLSNGPEDFGGMMTEIRIQ